MKSTLIISGGEINKEYLMKTLENNQYNEIIAVDGGLIILDSINVCPDVIIGDFDTVSEEILNKYMTKMIIRLNPQKDSTDTEEAVDYAISHNATNIDIVGALGGRMDHAIGNLFLLKKAYEKNVYARILSENNEICIISEYAKIYKKGFKYVSFIQFDGPATGVTLKGFKYIVENFDFDTSKTFRLGISNEIEDEYGEIYIREGYMLAILSKDK